MNWGNREKVRISSKPEFFHLWPHHPRSKKEINVILGRKKR